MVAPLPFFGHAARATTVTTTGPARQPLWNHRGPKLIEFDAPGATTVSSTVCAPYCGTVAYANNDAGAIVGFYTDKNVVPHGFLRYPNGFVSSFDAPGAGLGHGLNEGTAAYAINRRFAIAGQYEDSKLVYHGFVRHPDGTFTTFSDPLAGTAANLGTLAWDINAAEESAGIYIDAKGVYHGFLRDPSGKFATVDPPGSVYTYVCEETCLTTDGTLAGTFADATGVQHGFIRAPDGKFTTFSVPGAGTSAGQGSGAASLNDAGVISGYFYNSSNSAVAFIRYKNGATSVFPDPGFQTVAYSINCVNAIAGDVIDKNLTFHGFERQANGTVATFDAPNAAPGTPGVAFGGTRVSTNNAEGEVTGWYFDKKQLVHGFVWLP